jgi:ADP-ribose pyrophosphatase
MSALENYFAFVREHPWMFANPPGSGFTILLTEEEIEEVQSQVREELQKRGLPDAWAEVGVVYQDNYLLILRDAVRFPDSSTGTYLRVSSQIERGAGAATLPYYQGHFLLLRHFRHATRDWQLEIPRGFGSRGLSGMENARKELQEEIGATASRILPLGVVRPDTGMTSDVVELFFADIASYTGVEELEGVATIVSLTLADYERHIADGRITDVFTIAAYARAKLRGLF